MVHKLKSPLLGTNSQVGGSVFSVGVISQVGGSVLPSVTVAVSSVINIVFIIVFCFKLLKNNPHERSSHEGG
jgi:predicted PurR-regulated permease PerM